MKKSNDYTRVVDTIDGIIDVLYVEYGMSEDFESLILSLGTSVINHAFLEKGSSLTDEGLRCLYLHLLAVLDENMYESEKCESGTESMSTPPGSTPRARWMRQCFTAYREHESTLAERGVDEATFWNGMKNHFGVESRQDLSAENWRKITYELKKPGYGFIIKDLLLDTIVDGSVVADAEVVEPDPVVDDPDPEVEDIEEISYEDAIIGAAKLFAAGIRYHEDLRKAYAVWFHEDLRKACAAEVKKVLERL